MIDISTFERKTFRVQAVQVTVQNMKLLGEWCGGEFKAPEAPGRRAYVAVPNGRGQNISRAYVGDWITRLTEANSCRVYSQNQFAEAFKPIKSTEAKEAVILSAMTLFMVGCTEAKSQAEVTEAVNKATAKIMAISD